VNDIDPQLNSSEDFIDLLNKHQNIIHKICHLYRSTREEREDLFQEISIQLWNAYPQFKGHSKFSTWMYRVGLNTAITLHRKERKQIATSALDEKVNLPYQEEYDTSLDEKMKWLLEKLSRFSAIDKALVLLYLEDKKFEEIGETLGISSVNARVKMNRIKKKLKSMLNNESYE